MLLENIPGIEVAAFSHVFFPLSQLTEAFQGLKSFRTNAWLGFYTSRLTSWGLGLTYFWRPASINSEISSLVVMHYSVTLGKMYTMSPWWMLMKIFSLGRPSCYSGKQDKAMCWLGNMPSPTDNHLPTMLSVMDTAFSWFCPFAHF